uniref:uncharacterized protein LOC122601019 n=1 Tax=Erigeron canadensis TaxID=72917 RepID=UPI001CB9830A|nr:uncharacterized protein LOC122601019 [Erigeron canadensis]
MAKNVNDSVKEERIQWNGRMDAVFIEAMRKERDDGNRVGGTLTSLTYSNMVNYLREHLQRKFTKEHLTNRQKALKLHFSQCYDLFRGFMFSGFAWNSETSLIEAEEEVWETLIKEKPEAAKWKNKQIYHYEDLSYLFAEDRAKVMKSSHPHVYFEEEIYIGLESMDLAPNEIRKAYLYLVEHPGKARALCLDVLT